MDACKNKLRTMNRKARVSQKEAEEAETALASVIAKADALEASNAEVEEKICKIEDDMDATESKLVEQLRKLTEDEKKTEEGRHVQKQLEAAASKDGTKVGRMQIELDEMKARIGELKVKIESFDGQQCEAEEGLDECDERLEAAIERVGELEVESTSISNVLKSSQNLDIETERRTATGSTEIEKLSAKYAEVEKAALEFEGQMAALEEETDAADEALSAIKTQFTDTQQAIQSAVNEIADM